MPNKTAQEVYGYPSFLQVPIPEGEVAIDIRAPIRGDRIISSCFVDMQVIETICDYEKDNIRIILDPKPKRQKLVAKLELHNTPNTPLESVKLGTILRVHGFYKGKKFTSGIHFEEAI